MDRAAQTARLSRWSKRTVLFVAIFAVAGGLVAVVWETDTPAPTTQPSCDSPPCFGLDGLPRISDIGVVAPAILLGVAAFLGALALLFAFLGDRRRDIVILTLISAIGPLVVFVGAEVVPHVLTPCAPAALWGADVPGCVLSKDGWDVADRWHALDHAIVGYVPLSLAFAWLWNWRHRRT